MIAPRYIVYGNHPHPQYKPHGGNETFMYSRERESIISGPSETGKTLAACWKIHLLAMKYPNLSGAIVRKSQTTTYGTVLQTFKRVIRGAPVIAYGGERPSKYIYPNGSEIWVGGMDNSDKILSSERDFIYINQAEELTLDDWEKFTTRTTGRGAVMPYTQTMGDCNPSGSRHWIRERERAGVLQLITTTHRDNPTLYDPATGEITPQGVRTLATLNALTGIRRKRLLDGIWATAEGAVYDGFDPSIHVIERPTSDFTRFVIGADEGYTNPAVLLLVGVDGDGRLHIFKEFYRRGVLQSVVVDQSRQWVRSYNVNLIAVDGAAAGLIADLQDAGLPASGYKGRVLDGITRIQEYLQVAGDGRPRLTIDPACVETINELESYTWLDGKDAPAKEFDHAMDALRYLVVAMAGGTLDVF